MTTQLLEWYNLIFELPLGLALMYLALYTFSGWTFGEADADAGGFDHDVDANLDVHGDINLDHDADLSHDVHVDADADTDADADSDSDSDHSSSGSAFLSALNWIGVGRMPLSLVLMILMLSWGTLGIASMQVLHDKPIDRSSVIAIAIAAIGSLFVTHFMGSILGRTVFATLNISRRRHEILGSLGEALYPIDEKFGMVCGRDDRGELFQVPCRIEKGKEPISKGASVQLVAYTAADGMFYVVPAESSNTPRAVVGNKG